jgi:TIR domain
MTAPRVFVSYSHEESEHDNWVVDLTASLRKSGVDASVDRWDLTAGKDVAYFMESQIRDSDFVVLVCTPTYTQKSNLPAGGVGYEKNIISGEMLQARDLRPKFLPILRKGDYKASLPTYLGTKYAIDFRPSCDQDAALQELLRAIFGLTHPGKPPLGPSPFEGSNGTEAQYHVAAKTAPPHLDSSVMDIESWEKQARGRFEFLRTSRIPDQRRDPFTTGYWQGSFLLGQQPPELALSEFLVRLRASETHRTGWNIGWVPTRSGIEPYPFKGGVEVWLAEDGAKDPGLSDFWRAEPSGRFSVFRGYQEDGEDFPVKRASHLLDFSLVLWRVSEFLLYVESFANQMGVPSSRAHLKFSWTGLDERIICHHKGISRVFELHQSRDDSIESRLIIEDSSQIKRSLLHDVLSITKPLFEGFNFFGKDLTEDDVKGNLRGLFDPARELG